MKQTDRIVSVLMVAGSLCLASCSAEGGAGAMLPAVGNPTASSPGSASDGWLAPEATSSATKLYVASGNSISIFAMTGTKSKLVGQITKGVDSAIAVAVDRKGTLYVLNGGNGTVTKYRKGSTKPNAKLMLSANILGFKNIIVGKDGTIYVSELVSSSSNPPQFVSEILEYFKGAKSPSITLQFGGSPGGLALDKYNYLYVSASEFNVPGFAGAFRLQPQTGNATTLPITSEWAAGLEVDKTGHLLYGNSYGSAIDEIDVYGNIYKPLSAWTLERKIQLNTSFGLAPSNFVLDSKNQYLYVPGTKIIAIYDYASGSMVGAIAGVTGAIAISPPSPPL